MDEARRYTLSEGRTNPQLLNALEQIGALERAMETRGYLDGTKMATAFNMLRAGDLIWPYVVNNYMRGKAPFPFDLLYWNSDSTRMPAATPPSWRRLAVALLTPLAWRVLLCSFLAFPTRRLPISKRQPPCGLPAIRRWQPSVTFFSRKIGWVC